MTIIEKLMIYVKSISPTKILLAGYCFIILLGTLLLSLPISVQEGEEISLFTSFFTSTSATCVTGLVLTDTYAHWSTFGQGVILSLIQIGGLGFMTLCITAVSVTKRKIGMSSRIVMQNSIAAPQMGGIVRMTRFVFFGSLVIEAVGAFLLSLYFIPRLGLGNGIWYGIFHSVSAFCNAGFDIMGYEGPFSSLTTAYNSILVNIVIMLLIILGGLGFFVWGDMLHTKMCWNKLKFHSKVVLSVTSFLIVFGTVVIFCMEYDCPAFQNMTLGQQLMASLFQSVSSRTAGFNTIDLAAMTQSGLFMMIFLMLIGGSPGSTAGGIKTTTFAVLALSIITTMKRRKTTEAFGRRMEEGITRASACVLMSYLFLCCGAAMIITKIEGLEFLYVLFECVSAIATVGLTTGITPDLSNVSLTILALLMIFGRAGSITILRAFSSDRSYVGSELPREKIQIG